MELFLDSCDVKEIESYAQIGIIDGVTTNPSIIAKSGKDIFAVLKDICQIINTSVSTEVIATDYNNMLKEAMKFVAIGPQIVVKLPITWDGLKTCKRLTSEGIRTNLTLCFSPIQALMAAKAGATYVSPFIGRLDDIGHVGTDLISDIINIYDNYAHINTSILAASIRNVAHLLEVAKIGADIATVPPKMLKNILNHPLTEKGLEIFLNDWRNSKQKV